MFNQTTPGIRSSQAGVTYNLQTIFQDDGGLVEITRIKNGKIDVTLSCPIVPAAANNPANLITLRTALRRAGLPLADHRSLLKEFISLARKCQAIHQQRRVLVTAT